LASALPKKKEESRYSQGIISDFDLYFNGSTDRALNDILRGAKFDLNNKDMYHKIIEGRTNQRTWICKLRNNLIHDFELPETPDRTEVQRQKKAKITEEDVQKKVQASYGKIAEKRKLINLDDEEHADPRFNTGGDGLPLSNEEPSSPNVPIVNEYY
jgi:hypothetical protein